MTSLLLMFWGINDRLVLIILLIHFVAHSVDPLNLEVSVLQF